MGRKNGGQERSPGSSGSGRGRGRARAGLRGGGEGAAQEAGGAPSPRAPWPRWEMCVSRSVPSAALRRRPPAPP